MTSIDARPLSTERLRSRPSPQVELVRRTIELSRRFACNILVTGRLEEDFKEEWLLVIPAAFKATSIGAWPFVVCILCANEHVNLTLYC